LNLSAEDKYFKIGNEGGFVDLKNQKLILEPNRSFKSVKFSGDSFKIKMEFWIVGIRPAYKIFELEGSVRKKDGQFIFRPGKGKRASSKKIVSLKQEPNWDDDPLFGFPCKLRIKSDKKNGIKVEGGSAIEFFLPTFRFREMAKSPSSKNLDKIKLQVGTVVHNNPTEVSGKIDVGWSSLGKMVEGRLKEKLKKKYPGLSFSDESSLVTVKNKERLYDKKKLNTHRLEAIVLHCVSAKAYCTDPQFFSSREEQVENIPAMYDWEKCVEIFNKFRVGAHYIIGRDGKICELDTARMKVSHGGSPDRYSPMKSRGNAQTVGIELVGHAKEFRKEIIRFYKREKKKVDKRWATKFEEFVRSEDSSVKKNSTGLEDYINDDSVFYGFTDAQYEALKVLLSSLGQRYGYIRVCTHEWLKTTKSDPGDKFDWGKIKSALVEGGAPETEDSAFDKDHVYMVQKIDRFDYRE
jgi:N-acetyl-anhydromuramyl-L-alanine amidase AmpD